MRKLLVLAIAAAALWLAPGALASGWCGSGENTADLPDVNTGPQFHLVYAIPSDGTDNFAAVANQMADDVASIDSWWSTQDPTRELRFDTAQFPGCVGVDISFERLPYTGAQLVGDASTAFDDVGSALSQTPLAGANGAAWKDYLVYYDGPPPQPGSVCGTGGGTFDQGGGLAVVWLGACPGDPTDAIAAHEALHALGALPAGAPHACPGDPAHPCDSPLDVLYPYSSGLPLSELYLDWNHDDYYGHSGTWPDIQDVPFLHLLQVAQVPLTVSFQGAGSVTGDLPGVVCTASCTTQWDPGSAVALTAAPATTTRFLGWSGACSGDAACDVTLSQATSVTAVFGPQRIVVRASVSGGGRVVCTPACSTSFTAGDPLMLRAVPAIGWRFAGWSGACSGTRPACSPTTNYSLAVHATFRRLPAKAKPKKAKPKKAKPKKAGR